MRDVLFLNGRVDVDLPEFVSGNMFVAHCNRDSFFEHRRQAFRTNARSPSRHAGVVERNFVLHRVEAAEVLPVRVFSPAFQHGRIGFVERVLQIVQSDKQPNTFCGSSHVGAVAFGEEFVEPLPVDPSQQAHTTGGRDSESDQTEPGIRSRCTVSD